MNKNIPDGSADISESQVEQFQELIAGLYHCCSERMHYLSEKTRLPDAQLRCLTLFDDGRYLTPKGIAREMNVAKSRVTSIIGGLTQNGLVRRIRDPRDGRISLLSLTPQGRQKLDAIRSFRRRLNREVLSRMEPKERKAVLTQLELLKASMEAIRESTV
jgi:DNA-binding MarR family transcriptional regulator